MSYVIPIVIVLAIIQTVLDKKIRKEFVYGNSISDTNGSKKYISFIVITSLVVIVSMFFYATEFHWFVGALLTLIFIVRSIFERIYIRKTNRHIVSLLMSLLSAILTIILFLIWK